MYFLIDLRLIVFQLCRFAGGQLAALDALRDAVPLVLLALPTSLFGLVFCTAELCLSR